MGVHGFSRDGDNLRNCLVQKRCDEISPGFGYSIALIGLIRLQGPESAEDHRLRQFSPQSPDEVVRVCKAAGSKPNAKLSRIARATGTKASPKLTTATAKVPRLVEGVPEVRMSTRSAPPIRGEMSVATIGNLTRISVPGRVRHAGAAPEALASPRRGADPRVPPRPPRRTRRSTSTRR